MDRRFLIMLSVLPLCLAVNSRADVWVQTDWTGWPGQEEWADTTDYLSREGTNGRVVPGELHLAYWRDTGFDAGQWGADIIYEMLESYEGIVFAATGSSKGDVLRSWDYGDSWENTDDIPSATRVYDLIQASDSTLYAAVRVGSGGSASGAVYKSTSCGDNWMPTGDLGEQLFPLSLVEAMDGSIYVSTVEVIGGLTVYGYVLKSTDKGVTWDSTAPLPDEVEYIDPLLEDFMGGIYVAAILGPEAGESRSLGSGVRCWYPVRGGGQHQVFKTTDGGGHWDATGDLPESVGTVMCLLQKSDSTIYGGTCSPVLIKSTNWGATWDTTGPISEPGWSVTSLLEASDGCLYAGWTAGNGGNIFRSTDGGEHWAKVSDLWGDLMEQIQDVLCLLEDRWGRVWAGTEPRVHILKGEYMDGCLISSVYDAGIDPRYGTICWEADLHGQSLSFWVRTDTSSGMETAMEWEQCPICVNGGDLSELESVHDGDRYVQYRVEMSTLYPDVTPMVYEVSIEYEPMGGVEEGAGGRSNGVSLGGWYPNPFSMSTALRCPGHGSVRVYDLSGRLVRELVPERGSVTWDGRDEVGQPVASGVYLFRLTEAHGTERGKLVLLH